MKENVIITIDTGKLLKLVSEAKALTDQLTCKLKEIEDARALIS